MVVVFPFVPVTPATSSCSVGAPKNASAATAAAARDDSTTSWGTATSTARSTTSATAPFATASAASSWPSRFAPGMQTKSVPGRTERVSYARSEISRGRRPITSSGATARISASSVHEPSLREAGFRRSGILPRRSPPAAGQTPKASASRPHDLVAMLPRLRRR